MLGTNFFHGGKESSSVAILVHAINLVCIHCNVYRTVYLKLSASMFDLRWEKKLILANDVRD